MKEFDQAICYTLDLSCTKTPYVMRMLEVTFGKNIARRKWGAALEIGAMLDK